MQAEEIVRQLDEGTVLEGPHFGEPVRVLLAKARGGRVEIVAEGVNTKQTWKKLLKVEEFEASVTIKSSGGMATLTGDARQFRLAAEAHRIRLAYQYDPHFAVSVSQIDPLPHQLDGVYNRLLTQPSIRFLIADDPGAGKTIMGGLLLKEFKVPRCPEPAPYEHGRNRPVGHGCMLAPSAVPHSCVESASSRWRRSLQPAFSPCSSHTPKTRTPRSRSLTTHPASNRPFSCGSARYLPWSTANLRQSVAPARSVPLAAHHQYLPSCGQRSLDTTASSFDPFAYVVFHDHTHEDQIRYVNHFMQPTEPPAARPTICHQKPRGRREDISTADAIRLATLMYHRQHELIHCIHLGSLPLSFLYFTLVSLRGSRAQQLFMRARQRYPEARFLVPLISSKSERTMLGQMPDLAQTIQPFRAAWVAASVALRFFMFDIRGLEPSGTQMITDAFSCLGNTFSKTFDFPNTAECWAFHERDDLPIDCRSSTQALIEAYTNAIVSNYLLAIDLPDAVVRAVTENVLIISTNSLPYFHDLFPWASRTKLLLAMDIALMTPAHPYYLARLRWCPRLRDLHPGARFHAVMEHIESMPEPPENIAGITEYVEDVESALGWPSSREVARLSMEIEDHATEQRESMFRELGGQSPALGRERVVFGSPLLAQHINMAKLRVSKDNPLLTPILGGGYPVSVWEHSIPPCEVFQDGLGQHNTEFVVQGAVKATLEAICATGELEEIPRRYRLGTILRMDEKVILRMLVRTCTGFAYEGFDVLPRMEWHSEDPRYWIRRSGE